MNDKEKAAYVAAFIDGEGHVGLHLMKSQQGKRYFNRVISFSNTDKSLIDFMTTICIDLGFNPVVRFKAQVKAHHQPAWEVTLCGKREEFERFQQLIQLHSTRKQEKLQQIVDSYLPSISRMTFSCDVCAKTVARKPSQVGTKRYCSVTCKNEGAKIHISKICPVCEQTFTGASSRIKDQKYCSPSCRSKTFSARIAKLAKAGSDARWSKSNALH